MLGEVESKPRLQGGSVKQAVSRYYLGEWSMRCEHRWNVLFAPMKGTIVKWRTRQGEEISRATGKSEYVGVLMLFSLSEDASSWAQQMLVRTGRNCDAEQARWTVLDEAESQLRSRAAWPDEFLYPCSPWSQPRPLNSLLGISTAVGDPKTYVFLRTGTHHRQTTFYDTCLFLLLSFKS